MLKILKEKLKGLTTLSDQDKKDIFDSLKKAEKEYEQLDFKYKRATKEKSVLYSLLQKTSEDYALTSAKLKTSEANYREIFNSVNDAIFIHHPCTGKILDANHKAEEMYGYSHDEMRNLDVINISADVFPYDREHVLAKIEKAVGGTPQIFEWQAKDKQGKTFWVEVNLQCAVIGEQARLMAVVRDITERKQSQDALNHRLEMEKVLAEVSSLFLSIMNIDEALLSALEKLGTISNADSSYICFFKEDGNNIGRVHRWSRKPDPYRAEILQNLSLDVVPHWAERLRRREEVYIQNSSEVPREHTREWELIEILNLAGMLLLPLFIGNHFAGFMGFSQYCETRQWNREDISIFRTASEIISSALERKKIEEELSKIQNIESLGILAGGIAHDFNNILTSILGNISLAKIYIDGDISETLDILTQAERACIRAKGLTQQLLTFSRGGAPIKKTGDIGEVLKESATFMLRGSSIRCEFYISPDIWGVEMDEGQISQVIGNLVVNAEQSMPEGGIIWVGAQNYILKEDHTIPLPPGKYVRVWIKDNGVGISDEHLTRIFDPYFTTKKKGSGLGLATAYSIIRKHQGHIMVESQREQGSTFSFLIPASGKAFRTPVSAEKRRRDGGGKILLMDDDESVRDIGEKMLKRLGYRVESAKDGQEALMVYQSARQSGEPFDIVIMDLTIPGGMGGREAIERLLTLDPSARAVVSSGYSTDPIMSDYKHYGFQAVIPKPYTMNSLREILEGMLARG